MSDSNELTVDEYLEIRYEVQIYLQSKIHKESPSLFDELDEENKKIVSDYAKSIYEKSKLLEPSISSDLASLLEPNISQFASFSNRLKTMEGLKRKIISDSKDYNGSYYRATHNICDSIRYTILIPDDFYVTKVDEYLHRIEDMGYQVLEVKNNWGKPYYQGINVRIGTLDKKEIFELQFHTPFGYQIKEGSTRDLYEVVRDINAPANLARQADKLRRIFQSRVKAPNGAIGYEYDSTMKRRY